MRHVSLSLLAISAICAAAGAPLLTAADDPAPAGADASATSADATPDRGEAEAQSKAGMKALRDSDGDPHRAVDAALNFTHALKIYQALGDNDAVCEMQADIYWCKKKMNLDNLDDYLRQKGAPTSDSLAMKDILNKSVDVSEAQAYLDRAQRYVDANPTRHFQNAIRLSEVVQRFPDSDAAKKADPIMAKEQDAFLAEVKKQSDADHAAMTEAINAARESRFTKPPAVDAGSTAIPDQGARDKALATLKDLYKTDYAKKKDYQKRNFARKLASEAESSKDDAGVYYVMLTESVRLSAEAEDYAQLLDSEDRLAGTFANFDETADKKKVLKNFKSKPTAGAILTLMDDPKDKASNAVAGKFFCLSINRWDLGLPMLSLGGDKDLHDLAELELSDPHEPSEQLHTADAWYDLGKRGGSSNDKIGMWTRAQYWYLQAQPNINGVTKDRVAKQLAEIDKALPQVITDWDHLTPVQWDRIKAPVMSVPARIGRSDSGIDMTPDKHIRIVPQPTDKWTLEVYDSTYTCDYRGVNTNGMHFIWSAMIGKLPLGTLVYQVGSGESKPAGIVTGTGHLWVMPYSNDSSQGTDGAIRIKIVPVTDDN